MQPFEIGSIVQCRSREWIVLPPEHPDVLLLRPLGGSEAETCGIYLPLEQHNIRSASFAPPSPETLGDFDSAQLLRDAVRLSLRSGAGPFRSLGKLGARPRPYQLVPLIMALRLDPVRLLIADDVGIGKTIEAGLIVRELLDRGEIRRMTVLCPPHLCEQWQRELASKFAIEAKVIRSSTIAQLENQIPERERNTTGLWHYYPYTITSIDYVKSERNRAMFLQHCPEMVIVDEAHTAARPAGATTSQQQRFELVHELAQKAERNLLLLTATPHSGIEESFRSILGLLKPEFERYNLHQLNDEQRSLLSKHFIQRRRADVKQWLGEDTPFPEREWREATFKLAQSLEYRRLFNDVFAFARELVRDQSGQHSRSAQRTRVRYWTALALLRCVMSSPAAAAKALEMRSQNSQATDDSQEFLDPDAIYSGYVHDHSDQEAALDVEPAALDSETSNQGERTRLRQFAQRAQALCGNADPKLAQVLTIVNRLLSDGYNPIIYCRYIATANYLAEQLQQRIKTPKDIRIVAVTGERSEEEREAVINELSDYPRRLLVATDCLSEGINLQHAFDAVVHYDLPWNPNRLEQREGRVDRYGQTNPTIRTVLLHGEDNPIDQIVMKVLLRKAVEIHRSLGIAVPLPTNRESIMETMIQSLFHASAEQLSLFDSQPEATQLDIATSVEDGQATIDGEWNAAVEREKISRTRFAQRQIKPEEVAFELQESDAVLGDQATLKHFVSLACQRLGAGLIPIKHATAALWRLDLAPLPAAIRERLLPLTRQQRTGNQSFTLSFEPVGEPEVEIIGRNHPLTLALAEYLMETALIPHDQLVAAARSSVIRTPSVQARTVLYLLRVRMLIKSLRQQSVILAEELVVCGWSGTSNNPHWLAPADALELLTQTHELHNMPLEQRQNQLTRALADLEQATFRSHINAIAQERANALAASHNRVRAALKTGRADVQAKTDPDVLGVYLLLPAL